MIASSLGCEAISLKVQDSLGGLHVDHQADRAAAASRAPIPPPPSVRSPIGSARAPRALESRCRPDATASTAKMSCCSSPVPTALMRASFSEVPKSSSCSALRDREARLSLPGRRHAIFHVQANAVDTQASGPFRSCADHPPARTEARVVNACLEPQEPVCAGPTGYLTRASRVLTACASPPSG